MVKKSKKPKYCENSNMFSGILNVNTKVTLLFFLAIKFNSISKKYLSVFFELNIRAPAIRYNLPCQTMA
jgi:hypothetical protein